MLRLAEETKDAWAQKAYAGALRYVRKEQKDAWDVLMREGARSRAEAVRRVVEGKKRD